MHVYVGQTNASKELYKEVMKMKSLLTTKKNVGSEDKKPLTLGKQYRVVVSHFLLMFIFMFYVIYLCNVSIAEFINGQQYKYTCSINQRNARRLALKAAKILNVHIESEVDKFAYVANHHMKKPELVSSIMPLHHNNVVPLYHTFFLTFLIFM